MLLGSPRATSNPDLHCKWQMWDCDQALPGIWVDQLFQSLLLHLPKQYCSLLANRCKLTFTNSAGSMPFPGFFLFVFRRRWALKSIASKDCKKLQTFGIPSWRHVAGFWSGSMWYFFKFKCKWRHRCRRHTARTRCIAWLKSFHFVNCYEFLHPGITKGHQA